uniref:Solute carrier family 9 member B1 n=1 Tax=Pipistrellus kuhlii TaxID=59472 RepID=A0A7J8B507_PIPKU|nr:solute carrier family 9 member B1 [Pipistrellus kuhlii]
MDITELANKHSEDINIQQSLSSQIPNDYNTEEDEDKKIISDKEQSKPQVAESVCPPQGRFNKCITNGFLLFMIWFAISSVSSHGRYPNENSFGLLFVFCCSLIAGKLLQVCRIPSMPPLPPLLGMLLAGFTIRNAPYISEHVHISSDWSSTIRNIALTLILIKAGLGLDIQALKRLRNVCLRLSFGPCLMEACAAAVISHFLLNFPWQWGFLLGFVVGAVSPAVVVPSMLKLQEDGYGIEKGIPTILMAASSVDDILAITGFSIFMTIVFSSGGVLQDVLISFRNVVIGVLLGTFMGIFLQYFPSADQTNLPVKRACLILSLCVSVVLVGNSMGIHGTGGLFTLMLTFIGGMNWNRDKIGVQKLITFAWEIFQPLLFGLVGLEVSVAALKSDAIGVSIACLFLALLVRISATFFLVTFTGFNFKEKIFIAFSWIPKATVQAVLGPLALETARISSPHLEGYAKDVMTIAFLAILITAPNGALLINILGPRLLARYDPN